MSTIFRAEHIWILSPTRADSTWATGRLRAIKPNVKTVELAGLKVHLTGGIDGHGGGDGPVLVLLHGYGAPGTDLVSLSSHLTDRQGLRFAFPEAPIPLPSMFGSHVPVGRAWWPIDMVRLEVAVLTRSLDVVLPHLAAGVEPARQQLLSFLDELGHLMSAHPDRIILGGFSQGAMLALATTLVSPQPPAGLILMSGGLLDPREIREKAGRLGEFEVVLSHGRNDPLLPFDLALQLRGLLTSAGWKVNWVEFDGGHTIASTTLEAISSLVRRRFADPR